MIVLKLRAGVGADWIRLLIFQGDRDRLLEATLGAGEWREGTFCLGGVLRRLRQALREPDLCGSLPCGLWLCGVGQSLPPSGPLFPHSYNGCSNSRFSGNVVRIK